MFGSSRATYRGGVDGAFEVVVALGATYLFLSVVVLALVEMATALTSLRSRTLQKAIAAMLQSEKLEKEVLNHPLIRTMTVASGHRKAPSYIPAPFFARAVLAEVTKAQAKGAEVKEAYEGFLKSLDEPTRKTIEGVVGEAVTNVEDAQKKVEQWFDATMDRVSGHFKRRTQWYTRAIAITIVLLCNANTVALGRALWADPVARKTAAEFATRAIARCDQQPPPPASGDPGQVKPECKVEAGAVIEQSSSSLPVPLGWTEAKLRGCFASSRAFLEALLGFALTIFAVSLGAPFWFDMLRRLAPGIQQSGPKPDKA